MQAYYAGFVPSEGKISVTFPDVPGCITFGEDIREAFGFAIEALALHLEALAEDGLDIPEPSGADEAWAKIRAEQEEMGLGELPTDTQLLLVPAPEAAARDEATQEWVIVLDPNLATLFAADQYTRLQWGVRRALAAKPLAQWLHGFFSSHAAPKPIKVETLHRLSGSEAGELKHSTQALKAALEALEKASAAAGQVFAWRIEGGVLHVTRTPSPSQKRHLERQEGSA